MRYSLCNAFGYKARKSSFVEGSSFIRHMPCTYACLQVHSHLSLTTYRTEKIHSHRTEKVHSRSSLTTHRTENIHSHRTEKVHTQDRKGPLSLITHHTQDRKGEEIVWSSARIIIYYKLQTYTHQA